MIEPFPPHASPFPTKAQLARGAAAQIEEEMIDAGKAAPATPGATLYIQFDDRNRDYVSAVDDLLRALILSGDRYSISTTWDGTLERVEVRKLD